MSAKVARPAVLVGMLVEPRFPPPGIQGDSIEDVTVLVLSPTLAANNFFIVVTINSVGFANYSLAWIDHFSD